MSFFISENAGANPQQTVGDLRQRFKDLPNDTPVQWAIDGAITVSNIAGMLEMLAAVSDEMPFTYDVEYSADGWAFDIYGHISKIIEI